MKISDQTKGKNKIKNEKKIFLVLEFSNRYSYLNVKVLVLEFSILLKKKVIMSSFHLVYKR